jgi:hypothetical protein
VPDVDDLVVALAGGDHAVRALALDLQHLAGGAVEQLALGAGITMSSTPKEMPALVA